nr:alpha-L-arabinofuranosidase C-terminal domain-containing protein [Microbacter margulisiae]
MLSGGFAMAQPSKATLVIATDHPQFKIHKEIYGQFAEDLGAGIYGGIWVGKNSKIPNIDGYRRDIVNAIKQLSVPVIRWPGGCFADQYHWMDGIGPQSQRKPIINNNWGGGEEDNSFGTNEFLNFCKLVGAEPYISGNLGSGSPKEMSNWVQYITATNGPMADLRKKYGHPAPWKVKFWGVGNESWGCGGNMTPEYYSDLYRRFSTFLPNYNGNVLYKIASGANADDYDWTNVLMKNIGYRMQGISLHYYTVPKTWADKGSATSFSDQEYLTSIEKTLHMGELIAKHSAIMDKYDPQKKIGLVVDEWGIWTNVEPGTNPAFLFQQNSLRDAIIAALNFNIFNQHADRVRMANIAQMVNVLQSIILTKGDKMILTPTYYAFEMYKGHMGGQFLDSNMKCDSVNLGSEDSPMLSASASEKDGVLTLSIVNIDPTRDADLTCVLRDGTYKSVMGEILTSKNLTDINTFDLPSTVQLKPFTSAKLKGNDVVLKVPAKSIITLTIQ